MSFKKVWKVLQFFLHKINKIVHQLPTDHRLQVSFYMGELQISYRHPDPNIVENKLYSSTYVLKNFAKKNGVVLFAIKL